MKTTVEQCTITLSVPKQMAAYVMSTPPEAELLRNALLIYPRIMDQTISHGRAAELLGIPKWDLIELYAKVGIPYITTSIEEVEEDLQTLRELTGTHGC